MGLRRSESRSQSCASELQYYPPSLRTVCSQQRFLDRFGRERRSARDCLKADDGCRQAVLVSGRCSISGNGGTEDEMLLPSPSLLLWVSYLRKQRLLMPCTHIPTLHDTIYASDLVLVSVERTPDASDTLVHTPYRLRDLLQLLPIRITQQQRLIHDLIRVHVAHTNGFFATVDVLACDDGVLVRARRDGNFNARVLLGECRQLGLQECTEVSVRQD